MRMLSSIRHATKASAFHPLRRCPVACSNVSSIPEVVGSAAEMFDPDDPEQIAAAIERVCFDDSRRRELIKAGFERLSQFSWDRCASDTLLAYRSLLGSAAAL